MINTIIKNKYLILNGLLYYYYPPSITGILIYCVRNYLFKH